MLTLCLSQVITKHVKFILKEGSIPTEAPVYSQTQGLNKRLKMKKLIRSSIYSSLKQNGSQ